MKKNTPRRLGSTIEPYIWILPSVILMAMRTSQQQTFAVQEEWTFVLKLRMAETEAFFRRESLIRCLYSQLASIELWHIHVPQYRILDLHLC